MPTPTNTPPGVPPIIHTPLSWFVQATSSSGLTKMQLVRKHRKSKARDQVALADVAGTKARGGNFWSTYLGGVRRGLVSGDLPGELADAVRRCRPVEHQQYTVLMPGTLRLFEQHEVVRPVPALRGEWRHGGLAVGVGGLLGVERADGSLEAWWTYLGAAPLDELEKGVADYVVSRVLLEHDSPMTARVADLRRGELYELPAAKLDLFRRLSEAEAEAYTAYWRSAA